MMSSIIKHKITMGSYPSTMESWETSLATNTQELDDLNNRLNSVDINKKVLIAALKARISILNENIQTFSTLIDINKGRPW